MGNRAIITTKAGVNKHGLYVHWNGGRDSVEAVLTYINNSKKKFTSSLEFLREIAHIYKLAFGSKDDVRLWENLDLDNGDNGVYIIENYKNWNEEDFKLKIIGRMYAPSSEQNEYDLNEMLESITECVREFEFFKNNYIEPMYDLIKTNMFKYKVDYDNNKVLIENKAEGFTEDNPNKKTYIKVQAEMKEMYGGDYITFSTEDFGGEW